MAEQVKKRVGKPKKAPTPRQLEIKRIQAKPRDQRTEQEGARLDQLVKEERRERFLRLAPARVQKALDALARLSACGKRNSYTYGEDEAAKIVAAVNAAVVKVEDAFSERKEERSKFAL